VYDSLLVDILCMYIKNYAKHSSHVKVDPKEGLDDISLSVPILFKGS
jgi:hypothetical protein